jgi:hypothetical protein
VATFSITAGAADGYWPGSLSTWAAIRSATASSPINNSDELSVYGTYIPTAYYVGRSFLPFDTSPIPDDAVITGVVMRLTGRNGVSPYDNVHVVTTTNTSATLAGGVALANFGATSLGFLPAAAGINTPTDVTLTGATINKAGISYFGLRSGGDLNNSPTTNAYLCVYASEAANPGYRPMLIVTYTTGGMLPMLLAMNGD